MRGLLTLLLLCAALLTLAYGGGNYSAYPNGIEAFLEYLRLSLDLGMADSVETFFKLVFQAPLLWWIVTVVSTLVGLGIIVAVTESAADPQESTDSD